MGWVDAARLSAAWGEFPDQQRRALEVTAERVGRYVPFAEVVSAWGMPTFRVDGDILLSIQGFSQHNSVFPGPGAISRLMDSLTDFTVTKGTIHFDRDAPLSVSFVRSLVSACLASLNESYPKRSGVYKQYFANGGVKVRGKFKDDARHGEWRWWKADGELVRTQYYKLGKLIP